MNLAEARAVIGRLVEKLNLKGTRYPEGFKGTGGFISPTLEAAYKPPMNSAPNIAKGLSGRELVDAESFVPDAYHHLTDPTHEGYRLNAGLYMNDKDAAYLEGFCQKCAEYGVDAEKVAQLGTSIGAIIGAGTGAVNGRGLGAGALHGAATGVGADLGAYGGGVVGGLAGSAAGLGLGSILSLLVAKRNPKLAAKLLYGSLFTGGAVGGVGGAVGGGVSGARAGFKATKDLGR